MVAVPAVATAAESGAICVAPVPDAMAGTKSLANSAARTMPCDFSMSFDGGAPIVVSYKTAALAPALSLAARHRVRIARAGVAKALFGFRFSLSQYKAARLCLWFNPLDDIGSLSRPGTRPWCRRAD